MPARSDVQLHWLKYKYSSDGVPVSSSNIGYATVAARQSFSQSLQLLSQDAFIAVASSNLHGSKIRLTAKGHDEAALMVDGLNSVCRAVKWLPYIAEACQRTGKDALDTWVSELAVLQVGVDELNDGDIAEGTTNARAFAIELQCDMVQNCVAGLVELTTNTSGISFFKMTELGLSLVDTSGQLPPGYTHREGDYKTAMGPGEFFSQVDDFAARYRRGNHAPPSELCQVSLSASVLDDMVLFIGDGLSLDEAEDAPQQAVERYPLNH